MKDNEIALRSQQLSEQTGARQADALARQGVAWQQMPGIVTGFQESYARSQQIAFQAQRQHADMLHSASDLAMDELRRKNAAEELQWAQQLHTTDMLEYQKRTAKAQTEYEEARLGKLKEDLAGAHAHQFNFTDEEIDRMNALGHALTFQGGRVDTRDATPEEQARGQANINRKKYRDSLHAALNKEVWEPKLGDYRAATPKERREVIDLYQSAHSRYGDVGGLGPEDPNALSLDPTTAPAAAPTAAGKKPAVTTTVSKVAPAEVEGRVDLALNQAKMSDYFGSSASNQGFDDQTKQAFRNWLIPMILLESERYASEPVKQRKFVDGKIAIAMHSTEGLDILLGKNRR